MEKAREFFIVSLDAEIPTKEPVILRLLKSVSADVEKFKKEETNLPADDGTILFRPLFTCILH